MNKKLVGGAAALALAVGFGLFGSEHAKDSLIGIAQAGQLDRQCYQVWLDNGIDDRASASMVGSFKMLPTDQHADSIEKQYVDGIMNVKIKAKNVMGGISTEYYECPIVNGKVDWYATRDLQFKRTGH